MTENVMDVAEKIRFVQSTTEPMAWHTLPHVASVIAIEPNGETGRHVGSALRYRVEGRRTLVTAAHVARMALASPRFAVTAVRGEPPFELRSPPDHVDDECDIAVFFLPDDYPSQPEFWPEDRIDVTDEKIATDYLFVHGFPGERSGFTRLLNGLFNASLPYGVMLREDDLPSDITPVQFALDFDPANLLQPDGKPAAWVDPHGLSGSPVWRIGASGVNAAAWKPDLSQLVGIVTAWRPDERLLLATRAAPLVAMLRRG